MAQNPGQQGIDGLRAQVSGWLDTLNQASPIGSTVVFKVRKDKESTFEQNAAALTEATRKLPGRKAFGFHRYMPFTAQPADAVQHLIYEEWDSVKSFRVQWDSRHLRNFQYSVLDLIAAPLS